MKRQVKRRAFTCVELVIVLFVLGVLAALLLPALRNLKHKVIKPKPPVSAFGVKQLTVKVPVGADGLTAEQRNIKFKYDMDNKPGAIKHLYVVSAVSGDCVLYSTVDGKVTSSGKRLSPTTVAAGHEEGDKVDYDWGVSVTIGGETYYTTEVCQDDGTYGNSIDYLLWKDSRGIGHQHYPTDDQIIHVSTQPMSWPKIVLNLETVGVRPRVE